MNKLFKVIFCWIVCSLPINLYAAVQLEVRNNNIKETLWSDTNSLHVKNGDEPGYILVKTSQRQLFTINNNDRQIVNLSDKVRQAPNIPEMEGVSIEFVRHGAGPIMHGFDTELYLLKVNGEICRSEYLTNADSELISVLSGLELLTEYQINTTFASMPAQLDLCFVAEHLSYQRYRKHGFPVKSENQYGKTVFELISINRDIANPDNKFRLPEGYTVISYEEMMNSSGIVPDSTGNEMHPPAISKDIMSH